MKLCSLFLSHGAANYVVVVIIIVTHILNERMLNVDPRNVQACGSERGPKKISNGPLVGPKIK